MVLILLEALAALALLVLIVWWTMFHGRHHGELTDADDADEDEDRHTHKTGGDTDAGAD